jgi:hypothetical protein
MAIQNTTTVAAPIAPSSDADTYPVTDPKYGLGGLRTVETENERTTISEERKQEGMIVYQTSDKKYYMLISENDQLVWKEILILIPDGEGNINIQGNLIVSGYIETDTGIKGNEDAEQEYLGNGMVMDCGDY